MKLFNSTSTLLALIHFSSQFECEMLDCRMNVSIPSSVCSVKYCILCVMWYSKQIIVLIATCIPLSRSLIIVFVLYETVRFNLYN